MPYNTNACILTAVSLNVQRPAQLQAKATEPHYLLSGCNWPERLLTTLTEREACTQPDRGSRCLRLRDGHDVERRKHQNTWRMLVKRGGVGSGLGSPTLLGRHGPASPSINADG